MPDSCLPVQINSPHPKDPDSDLREMTVRLSLSLGVACAVGLVTDWDKAQVVLVACLALFKGGTQRLG